MLMPQNLAVKMPTARRSAEEKSVRDKDLRVPSMIGRE